MGGRADSCFWRFVLRESRRKAIYVLPAVAVVVCSIAATAQGTSTDDARLFKLRASMATLGKTGIQDSVWRYFSEQGARAYLAKNYESAEKYYRAALQDADQHKLHDANVAVLMTNLASTYREENKNDQAEPLYKQALEVSEKFGTGPGSPYAYALRQYAALLARTGRAEAAQFALAAAKSGSRLVKQSARFSAARGEPVPPPPLKAQVYRQDTPPGQEARMQARAQANDQPLNPGPGSDDSPNRPDGYSGGTDDRIVIDYTFLGLSQMPGQNQPSPQVYAHARTTLSPSQVGSILNSIKNLQLGPGLFGGQ